VKTAAVPTFFGVLVRAGHRRPYVAPGGLLSARKIYALHGGGKGFMTRDFAKIVIARSAATKQSIASTKKQKRSWIASSRKSSSQ
jgi:hypothetical protein